MLMLQYHFKINTLIIEVGLSFLTTAITEVSILSLGEQLFTKKKNYSYIILYHIIMVLYRIHSLSYVVTKYQ